MKPTNYDVDDLVWLLPKGDFKRKSSYNSGPLSKCETKFKVGTVKYSTYVLFYDITT